MVYQAQDLHLDRAIALKVLPEDTDAEREQHFIEEAKAVSALNHPNIVAIYDIDRVGGVHFIGMELVRGRSLSELIARKGLPFRVALKYAVQIADALAAAHTAGILHRDLRPANIMVTNAGVVKLLGFGLAELAAAPPDMTVTTEMPREPEPRAAESSLVETRVGDAIGEAGYQSPEQVEGKAIDRRSDIFSFGAVLYEMLTGVPAFPAGGELTPQAAILQKDPKPVSAFAPDVPPELERVVRRCLRKDCNRRFHVMDDLKLTLEELKDDWESGMGPVPQPAMIRPGLAVAAASKPWVLLAVVAALCVMAGALLGWRVWRTPAGPVHFKLIQLTRDSGVTGTPALSPDGKLVAYSSDRDNGENLDIWVQHVDGGGAIRLTTHPAADHSPSFSPDGTRIAFYSEREGGGIYVMPAFGGEARLIAKGGRLPRFSPDGRSIAYFESPQGGLTGGKIYVVALDGSAARQLQPTFTAAAVPVWTPDGKSLIFSGIHPTEGGEVWITPIDGGKAEKTGAGAILQSQGVEIKSLDALEPGGDSLFLTGSFGDSTNVWRLPMTRRWKAAGPAERLTSGTAEMNASIAQSGRVVFTAASRTSRVWGLPLNSDGIAAGQLEPVTAGGAQDTSCSISADGNMLAYRSNRAGNIDVWVRNLQSGKEVALTSTPEQESMPRISPDGTQVAYSVSQSQRRTMYVVPAAGGVSETVCRDCGPPSGWSPDGKQIYYTRIAEPRPQVWVRNVESGESTAYLQHGQLPLYGGRVSPDGKWFSFKGDLDSARTVIFAAPIRPGATPGPEEWVKVSSGRSWDDLPRWSADGAVMYYTSDRDGFRCIWGRRLDPKTKQPRGDEFAVVHLHKMQQSMAHLSLAEFELGAGRGRIVFPMAELRGNIWLMEPSSVGR